MKKTIRKNAKRRFRKFSKRLKRVIRRIAKGVSETKYRYVNFDDTLVTSNTTNQPTRFSIIRNLEQGDGFENRTGDNVDLTSATWDVQYVVDLDLNTLIATRGAPNAEFETICEWRMLLCKPKKGVPLAEFEEYVDNDWGAEVGKYGYPDTRFVRILKEKRGIVKVYGYFGSTDGIAIDKLTYEMHGPTTGRFKWSRKVNKKLRFKEDEAPYDEQPFNTNYYFIVTCTAPSGDVWVVDLSGYRKITFKDP